jgi:hypothetical protein
MLHRGMVIKAPGALVLSGLKAYDHLSHGGAGPKRLQEPDLRAKLAHVHPGARTQRQQRLGHNIMV